MKRGYNFRFLVVIIVMIGYPIINLNIFQKFCYNLGNVFRDRAILLDISQAQRDEVTRLALDWFAQSHYDEAKTLLGIQFDSHQVFDVALEQHDLSTSEAGTWLALGQSLQYFQALEIKNLDSVAGANQWTLITATGNSTRIEQGSLLGFVLLTTRQGKVHLKLIRVGVDVADWAYDFPDIPPRHLKPAVQIPLPAGGLGYPVCWTIGAGDTIEGITVAFLYPQVWHVAPSWQIIELSVTSEDRCSMVQ